MSIRRLPEELGRVREVLGFHGAFRICCHFAQYEQYAYIQYHPRLEPTPILSDPRVSDSETPDNLVSGPQDLIPNQILGLL